MRPVMNECEREIFSNTLKRGYRRVRSVSGRSAGAAHVSNSAGASNLSTDRFRSLRSRMSEAADAAMIEAADADGRLRDDPLTDRPVDAAAAAERERSAKAAKLAAQTANAMVAVQGQLKLRGQAADKAAHDANAEAGAPVKASSTMVERTSVRRNTKQR